MNRPLGSKGPPAQHLKSVLSLPRPRAARFGLIGLLVVLLTSTVLWRIASKSKQGGLPATEQWAGWTISLTVIDADTGSGIRPAKVTLLAQRESTAGVPGIQSQTLTTDPNGTCLIAAPSGSYKKMSLLVAAAGYEAKTVDWPPKGTPRRFTLALARLASSGRLMGTLLLPDGQSAAGAEVAVYVQGETPSLETNQTGAFRDEQDPSWQISDTMRARYRLAVAPPARASTRTISNADGKFVCWPGAYRQGIGISHELGYARVTFAELARSPTVTLKPWGRIRGRLRQGNTAGANKTIAAMQRYPDPDGLGFDYRTQTDTNGSFSFERVPGGSCEVSQCIPPKGKGSGGTVGYSHVVVIEVQPGRTSQVEIGGGGRLVVGRVVLPGQKERPDWSGELQTLIASRLDMPKPMPPVSGKPETFRAWHAYELAHPTYYLEFQPDGFFRVDDVPPGSYQLNLRLAQAGFGESPLPDAINRRVTVFAQLNKQITVPEATAGQSDRPVDLGDLILQRTDHTPGNAPDFLSRGR